MSGYADVLDFAGRAERQRKIRTIRQTTNEPDPITALMLKGEGYTIDPVPLTIGDYGWDIREQSWLRQRGYISVVLERKTLADMRDVERLVRQLRNMMTLAGAFPIILVEYKFDTDFKRKWGDKAIRNAKLSIQLTGVKVVECDENEVASAIDDIYKWSQKRSHSLAPGGEEDA